jgi:hypothetical protein
MAGQKQGARDEFECSAENLGNRIAGATLFLAAMVGGVAVLIVLFCAAVGFFIGLFLEAGYGWWSTRKRSSVQL